MPIMHPHRYRQLVSPQETALERNPMKYSVTRLYTFDASHQLLQHKGKCARLHGHTYQLEVTIEGFPQIELGSSQGMVIDYGDLDDVVKPLVEMMDHHHLNDVMMLNVPATAENIGQTLL